ncbi:hypothetical protein D9613_010564 [Agrocybe pediades]|uniref:Uncharacterized protein n=1 Tax=Agrocybe pediades TaxID=84607 RepID=A0A8H4QFB2_9AGAR|nr:hypothetical protein D9613_010564 [Agrocybe pediades]
MSDPRDSRRDVNDASRTGSQRGVVKSTRTPINMDYNPSATTTAARVRTTSNDAEAPHRSKSVPNPAPSSSSAQPKRTMTTMPTPAGTNSSDMRQRTASNSKAQPNAIGGTATATRSTQAATGSERPVQNATEYPASRRTHQEAQIRGREQEDPHSSYLMPPRRPYNPTPASDTRQSTSSFQTEPSSYYSVEDNMSSAGGPSMPMPQHELQPPRMPQPYRQDSIHESEASSDQDLSPEAQYEKLWNAAQTDVHTPPPPMPVPDVGSPPMPAPYLYEERQGDNEAEGQENIEGEEGRRQESRQQTGGLRMPEARRRIPSNDNRYASMPPGEQLGSAFSSRPSPAMPTPSQSTGPSGQSTGPPMPSPGLQTYPTAPETSPTVTAHSRPTSGPGSANIAPLRIHHARPAGTGQATSSNAFSTASNNAASAPPPAAGSAPASSNQSTIGRPQQQTQSTISGLPRPSVHDGRPGVAATPSNSQIHSRPSGTAAASTNTSATNHPGPGRTNYVVPNFGPQKLSPVEPRPPGASAPSIPSGVSASVQRPSHSGSIYPQTNTQGASRPPATTTPASNSAFSASQVGATSRIENQSSTGGQGKMPTSILLNNNNRPQIPNVPQQAPPKPASSFSAGPPSSAAGATHANLSTAAASHTQNHTPQAARPQQAQTETNSFTTQPSKPVTTAPQVQASTSSHSNTHAQSKIEQHSKPAAAPAPAPAPSPAKTPAAASAAIASAPTRPHLHGNPSQMDTQYVNMLLALDDIPALHNIAAQFFTWILLAGFILFPGTFTNLQNDNGTLPDSVRQELLKVVNNLPLIAISTFRLDHWSLARLLPAPAPPSSAIDSQPPSGASDKRCFTHREMLMKFKDVMGLPMDGAGPFVPQLMYKPHTTSDRRRYAEEVLLEDPLYFVCEDPQEYGISLKDALHSRTRRLRDRDQVVFEDRGSSVSIRLEWPGYRQWSRQIPTKDFRSTPQPITMAKLATNVASCVQRFMQDCKAMPMEDDADHRWRIGDGPNDIKLEDLILVSIHHVSLGSWQPQLRLARPLRQSGSCDRSRTGDHD